MSDDYNPLRDIPKVDDALAWPKVAAMTRLLPRSVLAEATRRVLEDVRRDILEGGPSVPEHAVLEARIAALAMTVARASLRPVVNATGIPLHTNFGRAPLAAQAVLAVADAARGYTNLEYDLATGGRGSRHSHVSGLLAALTGAEAGLVVNNNAAAVLLVLSALTAGREVVVSRGELVEIGGGFRVPEVMAQSGAVLREVGTTNKTRLADYEAAIGEDTAALLKVHTSNFAIVGFTESAGLSELAGLAHSRGLPLIHDLGSGCLNDPRRLGTPGEPTVRQSVRAGADIVTFSGDKLLGGPQAGLIVGKLGLIDRVARHPLARAVRIDKLSLAALEATLRLHLDPDTAGAIPAVAMLSATPEALERQAAELLAVIESRGALEAELSVEAEDGRVGGGSAPDVTLDSRVVAVRPHALSLQKLETALRDAPLPIVARISRERLVLDVRTLRPEDYAPIADALAAALGAGRAEG